MSQQLKPKPVFTIRSFTRSCKFKLLDHSNTDLPLSCEFPSVSDLSFLTTWDDWFLTLGCFCYPTGFHDPSSVLDHYQIVCICILNNLFRRNVLQKCDHITQFCIITDCHGSSHPPTIITVSWFLWNIIKYIESCSSNNTITDGGVAPRCSFAGPT